MTEELKETNGNRWHFWFLVTFSLLLVITFVFYLPTRFERNFLLEEAAHTDAETMPHMDEEMMDMMHGAEHGGAVFHEGGEATEGLAINLNASPAPVLAGSSTQLDFFVNEKPGNIPVPFSDLELNHTKLMHVIGVRSDLSEFFHIHPEQLEGGIFTIPYVFSSPGTYKLWSEVKKDGVVHTFGHPVIDVQGAGERENKRVSFGRNVVVEDYQVALELEEPVVKGHEHDLSFDIHTLTGGEVETEDYLGAPMHVVVIKDDLTQFIHAHPQEGAEEGAGDHQGSIPFIQEARANGGEKHEVSPGVDETIKFRIVFPEAGLYKVFAQFRPQGTDLPADEALTASFWIQVEEGSASNQTQGHEHAPGTSADHHESTQLKPLVSPAWWLLLVVSFGLIALLSLAIHKFITIRK